MRRCVCAHIRAYVYVGVHARACVCLCAGVCGCVCVFIPNTTVKLLYTGHKIPFLEQGGD